MAPRSLYAWNLEYLIPVAGLGAEPEMVEAFVETHNDEREAMAADSIDEKKEISGRLANIENNCARWTEMLFNDGGDAKNHRRQNPFAP